MKRIISIILALMTLASVFAGCGDNKKSSENNGENQGTAGNQTPAEPERTYESPMAEALITVAEAYLARRNYIQYCDTRLVKDEPDGIYYRWETATNSPEDSTPQYTTYSNCAAFCYDVYYQALGIEIGTWSTSQMMNATEMHVFKYDVTGTETDEEKAKIKEEYTSHLQQGDLIVYRHKDDTNGHVMLYIGDGDIIHCSAPGGGNYDYANNTELLEPRGAISEMSYDELWNPSTTRYMFSMKNFAVMRPTIKYTDAKVTEEAQNRVKNLKNIYIEKTCSAGAGFTVNPGEELTYTYSVRNSRATEAVVEIVENVPANTAYVSGAEKQEGSKLYWTLKIPAGQTVKVSYTVKTDAGLKTGDTVLAEGSVGGVAVKCRPTYIGKHLTADEQSKVASAVKANATSNLRGTELAEKIYADIGRTIDLPDDKTLVNSFFTSLTSTHWRLNAESEHMNILVPTMYGGYFVALNRQLYGAWRTKGPLTTQLMPGDIIICFENNKAQSYMIMGGNLVLDLTANKQLELAKTVPTLLSTIGYDQFVIVRPAMAQ